MEIIVFVSFLLLFAWFCYACRLIIANGGDGRKLEVSGDAPIAQSVEVERDYLLISYLMQNGNEFLSEGEESLHQYMIRIYYRTVLTVYKLSSFGPKKLSALLLQEMATIVSYMADSVGHHPRHADAVHN